MDASSAERAERPSVTSSSWHSTVQELARTSMPGSQLAEGFHGSLHRKELAEWEEQKEGESFDAKAAPKRDETFVWDALAHKAVKGGAKRTDEDVYKLFVRGTRVFEPRSRPLVAWLTFVLVVTLYASIETPVEIAWYSPGTAYAKNAFFLASNICIIMVFACDILVTCNLAFVDYTGGRGFVSDRRGILVEYFSTWFVFDLLATLPFDLIFRGVASAQTLRLLKMLRLVRVAKLVQVNRLLRVIEGQFSVDYDRVNLSLFLFLVVLVMHIMGCGLFIVATLSTGKRSFISENEIISYSVSEQYVYGLYWAAMTISTIGYGDVVISSTGERVYAIFCMLGGASLYAYLVGSLVGIMQNMNQRENERRQCLKEVNTLTGEAGLPNATRRRIRTYFSKTQNVGGFISLAGHQETLRRLSPPMAAAVVRHVLRDWVPNVPWLRNCKDSMLFVELSAILREQCFAPQEPVIEKDNAALSMFVIRAGTIFLLGPGRISAGGRCAGEEVLLPICECYGYDVYSGSYLDCWRIDRDEFQMLISRFPLLRPKVRWAAIAVLIRRRDLFSKFQSTLYDVPRNAGRSAALSSGRSDLFNTSSSGSGVPVNGATRAHAHSWHPAMAAEAGQATDGAASAAAVARAVEEMRRSLRDFEGRLDRIAEKVPSVREGQEPK